MNKSGEKEKEESLSNFVRMVGERGAVGIGVGRVGFGGSSLTRPCDHGEAGKADKTLVGGRGRTEVAMNNNRDTMICCSCLIQVACGCLCLSWFQVVE